MVLVYIHFCVIISKEGLFAGDKESILSPLDLAD